MMPFPGVPVSSEVRPPGMNVMTMAPQITRRMPLRMIFLVGPWVCKNRIISYHSRVERRIFNYKLAEVASSDGIFLKRGTAFPRQGGVWSQEALPTPQRKRFQTPLLKRINISVIHSRDTFRERSSTGYHEWIITSMKRYR